MSLFSLTVIFLILLDPLGNVPVFLALLKNIPQTKQTKIIIRECIIAFAILTLFLFFGKYIMLELQITSSALGIAGGIILFLIALKMIFPPDNHIKSAKPLAEPFIVPLAMPMVAGPSMMAMLILLSTQHPDKILVYFIALIIASFLTATILVFSSKLQRWLGEKGLIALERLMGMILTVVAVQMLLNSLSTYLKQL